MEKVTRIRKGQAVKHNQEPCIVIDMQHKTPPNLSAFVQMSIRNIASGKVYHLRFSPGDSIETVNVERQNYEFSYTDPTGYHFLHEDTYEDVAVSLELATPIKDFLIEGGRYVLVFVEGRVASVELPASIVMTVTEAPEGVKGDSTTNVYKAATTESGLVVQVPLFIKSGDRISIKTEDRSYLSRA
jgi:elongation factor P